MKVQAIIAAAVASAAIAIVSYSVALAGATGETTLLCYPANASQVETAKTDGGSALSCKTLASVMMDPSTGQIRKPQHAANATPGQIDYAWNSLLRQELLAGH